VSSFRYNSIEGTRFAKYFTIRCRIKCNCKKSHRDYIAPLKVQKYKKMILLSSTSLYSQCADKYLYITFLILLF